MIPLKDAQEYVLQHCRIGHSELRSSRSSLGLVLAEEVLTSEDVPPFDNTAMDGFAVRSEDTLEAPTTRNRRYDTCWFYTRFFNKSRTSGKNHDRSPPP